MNPLSDITNAPVLYKIGDDTYEVSALDHGDMGAYARFVQFDEYYTLKALPDIPKELLDKVLMECAKKQVEADSPQSVSIGSTPKGYAECAYLSLRHKHKDITREKVLSFEAADVLTIATIATLLSRHDVPSEKKVAAVNALLIRKQRQNENAEPSLSDTSNS